MDRITIRAFRAIDSKEDTMRCIIEHSRVLEDIGVTAALKIDYAWCLDPETVIILAHHELLGPVGGCRIQYSSDPKDLPLFKHLLPFEPDLFRKLGSVTEERCFELAGLWVAHRFSGHGLPWLLTAAAVAVMDQLDAHCVLCFAADYSKEYAIKNGFEIMDNVGDMGKVEFPIAGITSYALINRSIHGHRKAAEHERDRLISLLLCPEQARIEEIKGRQLEVQYRLQLRKHLISLNPSSVTGRIRKTGTT